MSVRNIEIVRDCVDAFNRADVPALRFDEIRDAHDQVVAIGSLRIRPLGGGPEAEIPTAVIYTLKSGKVTRAEDLRERDLALRAVGLDPET